MIGATGGITNARGLCRLYSELARPRVPWRPSLVDDGESGAHVTSDFGRLRPVRPDPARASPPATSSRWTTGAARPGNQDTGILSEDAFGHSGFGGSIGFADPRAGLSFGYAMNRQGPGTLLNPRGQSLVDAAYRSLGYSEEGGSFVRR